MPHAPTVVAFLGLGSSLGDRLANLRLAVEKIGDLPKTTVKAVSPVYETDPVGGVAENRFLNAAIAVKTDLAPKDLLKIILDIERQAGRTRKRPLEDRTLDIDILLFSDAILDEDDLVVPHPRLIKRPFALAPLADIAPEAVHPENGQTIKALCEKCPPTGRVIIRHDMAL